MRTRPKLRKDAQCELCEVVVASGICGQCGYNLCPDCYKHHNDLDSVDTTPERGTVRYSLCMLWGRELAGAPPLKL